VPRLCAHDEVEGRPGRNELLERSDVDLDAWKGAFDGEAALGKGRVAILVAPGRHKKLVRFCRTYLDGSVFARIVIP